MRKLLFVALPIGLAILGAVALVNTLRVRTEAADARLERARLKRDFTERAQAAKSVAPERPAEWQAEVAALSRWYFDELQGIRNRHPGEPARPTGVQAAEQEHKGKLKSEQREQLEDFQTYADSRFALLREGKYGVVASAAAEGLRLDLLSVEPGKSPEGAQGLRVDFALWGAPRYVERERANERTVTRNVVPVAFKRIVFEFLDPAGKLYGEMSGAGEPYQKLTDPERFVDDFPSGVLFGTWWVEQFPREAATVKFTLDVDQRVPSGAARPATFTATVPVPETWKLPPGTAFQGEIQIREAAQKP
ncbi:MAG TPA: hypothetical protein VFL83_21805 [Anaeromyxobacter sp.]|nr:hypothetical protein [Anaeromyxobacter sp.]